MPAISLVVCIHNERDLLERLLRETAGLYDDLVVVHDGPEGGKGSQDGNPSIGIEQNPPAIDYSELASGSPLPACYTTPFGPPKLNSIHELVTGRGGKFFEGPRCFQQEPHWPFAWSQTAHDWILRLDADEFPSEELRKWLSEFRLGAEKPIEVSGYTCIWPVWSGKKAVTHRWPAGRNFLFHRRRVRFFGVVEWAPVADRQYEPLSLILRHEPLRKSHGLRNILIRRQGAMWRSVIAHSLLHEIDDLPRWRWTSQDWPNFWHRLRRNPIRAGFYFLARNTLSTLRDHWRSERRLMPLIAVATPLHHLLVGLSLYRLQKTPLHGRVNAKQC